MKEKVKAMCLLITVHGDLVQGTLCARREELGKKNEKFGVECGKFDGQTKHAIYGNGAIH